MQHGVAATRLAAVVTRSVPARHAADQLLVQARLLPARIHPVALQTARAEPRRRLTALRQHHTAPSLFAPPEA